MSRMSGGSKGGMQSSSISNGFYCPICSQHFSIRNNCYNKNAKKYVTVYTHFTKKFNKLYCDSLGNKRKSKIYDNMIM
jgi:hypothetical protein